jgi:hypothetical protein
VKNFAVSRPKVAVVLGKYSRELLPPPGNTGEESSAVLKADTVTIRHLL